MDRSKEGKEQPQMESTKPILTPLITSTNILTATDDDTSTESSDTFETWTLVSDKQKKNKSDVGVDIVNRIEILKKSEPDEKEEEDGPQEKMEEQQLQDSLNEFTNDDFSDGISIISESESVGRISPHPYLRDNLQDLHLKFSTNDNFDDIIFNKLRQETPIVLQHPDPDPEPEQQIRQRRRSSSATPPSKDQALQKASQTLSLPIEFPPLVKRGLQGMFYVCVGLAILGLIGKIVYPTWQPLANVVNPSASTGELEQKVNDMELQNNLMRAEIDILNKQVKYLSTLNDPQQQQQHQQKRKYKDYKEGKTFKAWSGNGDSLKPVDITKEDLRRPYKCPDGHYVEIANMCIEQRPHDPSIVDQFGQVVEDLKKQSEAFKTFEQVAEELQGFQDNPFEQLEKVLGEEKSTTPPQQQSNEFIKNKPVYQPSEDFKRHLPRPNLDDNQQHQSAPAYIKHKYDRSQGKYEDSSKPTKADKKQFVKEFNTENKEFKKPHDIKSSKEKLNKFRDNLQERFERFRDNSKEKIEKFIDNSKEKFEKFKENSKLFLDSSKERKSKKFDDSKESKENYSKQHVNKQKRKFDRVDDDDDDSGEWQEKYMKHRENTRKQNEQKYQDNKNWYIKRGDSREYKRSGEKQSR